MVTPTKTYLSAIDYTLKMKHIKQGITWTIFKEKELDKIAKEILDKFPRQKLFLLSGDLGTGKTTFVKKITAQLGIEEAVSSPSFSLVNEYKSPNNLIVYHMDLYRLEKYEEALEIGIEEYIDSGAYVFIEWPEIISPLIDAQFSKIAFELLEDQSRKINFIVNAV